MDRNDEAKNANEITANTEFIGNLNSNKDVAAGINEGSWQRGWFIAQGVSNHQKGVAMDCSLVKVKAMPFGLIKPKPQWAQECFATTLSIHYLT